MNAPTPGHYAIEIMGARMSPYPDFFEALMALAEDMDEDGNAKATLHQIIRENPKGLFQSIRDREQAAQDLAALKNLLR